MTRRALRSGGISEESIKTALTENKGDLFLSACALDCTARELDLYIRRSAELQAFASAIEQVKTDASYSRMSVEQFENQVENLKRSYRIDGVNEIHKLATMDFGDSAALAKVKLDAALALAAGPPRAGAGSDTEMALAELNNLYHQNAPRIKEIRQTVITLRDETKVTPLTIEQKLDR